MKVLSGKYKGRNYYMPEGIRPTQNMLRKAIFDILGHDLSGVEMLDLFAGSGAVGIEALSNEVKNVLMVERDHKNAKIIEENVRLLDPDIGRDRYKIHVGDVFATIKLMARTERRFNVVFFDPPYGQQLGKKTLNILITHDILTPHSFVVAKYDKFDRMPDMPDDFTTIKHQKYGTSFLTVYERKPKGATDGEDSDLSG